MAEYFFIRDLKLIHDGEQQSVAIEFGDGKVQLFSARELYEATGFMGRPSAEIQTGAQRRAAKILSTLRNKR